VTAVLTPEGKVALIASSAKGHSIRGVHPGDRASVLRGQARKVGKGVWISKLGKKKRVAYEIKGKRITTIAVAGRDARGRKTLRSYLGLVPKGGFTPRARLALTKRSRRVTPRNASPLVHSYDPDRRAWYCSIGL
jgi:hypothetical protein